MTDTYRNIIETCASYDGYRINFPYDDDETLYLAHEIQGQVVGVLAAYRIDEALYQIYAAVLPKYRRRVVFATLIEKARQRIGGSLEFSFAISRDMTLARDVLEHMCCQRESIEYEMRRVLDERIEDVPESIVLDGRDIPINVRELGDGTDGMQIEHKVYETLEECIEDKVTSGRCEYEATDVCDDMCHMYSSSDSKSRQYSILLGEKHAASISIFCDSDGESCCIYDFEIDEKYRGRGLGRAIFGCALRRLYSDGYRQIRLHVIVYNEAAVKVYKIHKFKIYDEIWEFKMYFC